MVVLEVNEQTHAKLTQNNIWPTVNVGGKFFLTARRQGEIVRNHE